MNQRQQQLKNSISHSFVNKWERLCDFREIQDISSVVNDDEYIIQAVNGFFSRDRGQTYSPWHTFGTNGTGLIILTNKEIILFNHALFFNKISPSIPLQQLHSITPSSGLLYGYIDFDDGSSHPFRASHILAWKCDKFKKAVDIQRDKVLEHLNQQTVNYQSQPNNPQNTNSVNPNIPNQYQNNSQNNQQSSYQAPDPIKELQELNQMHANNQINDADYNKMKHKIIG